MTFNLTRLPGWLLLTITVMMVMALWGNYAWTRIHDRNELARQVKQLARLEVTDPPAAVSLAQEIRAKAIQTGDDLALGKAYFYLARLGRDAQRFSRLYGSSALRIAERGHEVLSQTGDPVWQVRSYALLADIHSYQLSNPDSLLRDSAYQQHLAHLKKLANNLATVPGSLDRESLWAEYYKIKGTGVKLAFHADPDSMLASARYLAQALERYQSIDNPTETAISARSLSDAYVDLALLQLSAGDTTQANMWLDRAEQTMSVSISHFRNLSDSTGLSNALTKRAEITEARYMANLDVALLEQALYEYQFVLDHFPQAAKAQVLYRKAWLMFASFSVPGGTDVLHQKLYYFYQSRVLFAQAAEEALKSLDLSTLHDVLKNWERTVTLEDSLGEVIARFKTELLPQLALRASEQESQVQKQIRRLDQASQEQRRREQQRLLLLAGGSLLALLATAAFMFFQQRSLIHMRESLDHKIRLASTRMNPHFIGNTLNALDNLILTGKTIEASKYLVRFSRLAKDTFRFVDQASISLQEEYNLLQNYLMLEKLRVGEDFAYSIDIDARLDKKAIQVPPMLMQPLVENAIWHGLQPILIKGERPGHLHISFAKEDASESNPPMLVCVVEDNGIGRPSAKAYQNYALIERRDRSSTQVMLERLKLIGHDKAQLEFTDLVDQSGVPTGTRAVLRVHLKEEPK